MYCTNCNKTVGSDYVICPDCGASLEQTEDEIQINEQPYQYQPSQQPIGVTNKWTTYLVFSIIAFLCCNQIAGIIGIIFAALANSDYNAGRYDEYNQKLNISKWALIIGVIIGVIVIVFAFLGGFIGAING